MLGKTLVFATAVVLAAVSGCAKDPPPYESRYTPPPPVAPPPPPLPPGASFLDDFERPDTEAGLDGRWQLRAADPGDPATPVGTGAFIRDGHYVSSDNTSNVFAVQTLRGTVRRVGAEGRWTQVGDGGYETLVMGISADADLSRNLVQLTVSPVGWVLSSSRDTAAPQPLAKGEFNPPLAVNGTYRFEMDAADGSVTVRVPGAEKQVKVGTLGLLSERVYWQHVATPAELPIGQKFCVDLVWAAEQGQPLSAVPAE